MLRCCPEWPIEFVLAFGAASAAVGAATIATPSRAAIVFRRTIGAISRAPLVAIRLNPDRPDPKAASRLSSTAPSSHPVSASANAPASAARA